MKDPYLYEDVPVLVNKLNIKNEKLLSKAEADITVIKLLSIDLLKGRKTLNVEYLKDIHRHIFEDIYPFAGELRTIHIEKPEKVLGGDTVRYAAPNDIDKMIIHYIDRMDKVKWSTVQLDDRALEFSKCIAGIWQAHPFREGNTRTIMTFACHYAEAHGFPLDKQIFSENAGYVRNALVKASDGMYAEYQFLSKILKHSMILGEEAYIIDKIKAAGFKPTNTLIDDMKKLNQTFLKLHSVKDLKTYQQNIDSLDPDKRELVQGIVKDFAQEEKKEKHKEIKKGKGFDLEI